MDVKDAYIGTEKVGRMYHGDNVVFPAPVQDGLVLWYDFMGRRNSDVNRATAEDLSGNGNDGELINFAFEEGSGYANGHSGGVALDGVDDYIQLINPILLNQQFTWQITVEIKDRTSNLYLIGGIPNTYLRYLNGNLTIYLWSSESKGMSLTAYPVIENGGIYEFVVTLDNDELSVFVDGKFSRKSTLSNEVNQNCRLDSFGKAINIYSGLSMCSAKIYNRALSLDEIQHNYEIEKRRWAI